MSKKAKVMLGVIGALFVLFILFFTIFIPSYNDYVASKTAKAIISVPLPDNTQLVESKSLAGKLVGNGNGMQYFGAVLIKSSLSLDELKQYYSGFAYNDWTYCVEKQQNSNVEVIEHSRLSFDTHIQEDGYYIVYSWGDTDFALRDFDIRGH